jgi:hypothetical protein
MAINSRMEPLNLKRLKILISNIAPVGPKRNHALAMDMVNGHFTNEWYITITFSFITSNFK